MVLRAELAEYSDVKGCMIIRPHGYAIWENSVAVLDAWFKADNVQNVYFPIFIPMSLFQKEKEHVAGFSPELAVVTIAGGEELTEPLAVRPTSETVITQKFAEWIQSHRDLPMKLNQWCNVVRWEKRTYPFMRTSEFLWQEGHTAHAGREDAMAMTLKALEWYRKFYEEYYGISVYAGLKSRGETFAGAVETYAIELVMPDGKALQAATSHYLGENFGKAFNVQYLDDKGEKQFVHQTSWGFSTRAIGGLILSHGDDSGLVLPPKVAPIQVVILPVSNKDAALAEKIKDSAEKIRKQLAAKGVKAKVDDDAKSSLGFRINNWELKGVPLRLEIGAKELENNSVGFVRRDNFEKGQIKLDGIERSVADLLEKMQSGMFAKSDAGKKALTFEADEIHEFKRILAEKKAFVRVPWCEDGDCETRIKTDTKATPRVLELDRMNERSELKCFACGKKAARKWLFAQSY